MNSPEPAWFLEPRPRFQHNYKIHILLLLITLVTTTFVSELFFFLPNELVYSKGFFTRLLDGRLLRSMMKPDHFFMGVIFSTSTLFILLVHEMGHYLTCRRHNVDATLPYFIPFPLGIGTLGAFIKIREPIPTKRQLFDIGAGGPIAGFLASLPFIAVGTFQSPVTPLSAVSTGDIVIGPCLLTYLAISFLKHIPEGHTIFLHPMFLAGWVGMLATCLNLLPFGQLDGGHVMYSVLGKKQHRLALPLYILLVLFGVLWQGWWIWAIILLFIGIRHPRMWDESIPLNTGRILIALGVLIIFILSFMPLPIGIMP